MNGVVFSFENVFALTFTSISPLNQPTEKKNFGHSTQQPRREIIHDLPNELQQDKVEKARGVSGEQFPSFLGREVINRLLRPTVPMSVRPKCQLTFSPNIVVLATKIIENNRNICSKAKYKF